MELNILSIN